ncbi:ABC transporter ATP-binding protein [Paenibacillus zanthoxyli]|uniref:ABC transporter ATP-binding protein n=1 Tax=Paenibacillus zanthoxyli TaxID=369399 RepID=UPI0004BCC4FC|nr:ABC transporter ATP-binding protein [Paenibacillus zanthoxyli]
MLLELSRVKKRFKNGMEYRDVLDGVELQIHAGDSIAIKGKSGCGKSTLLNILGGLLPCDEGIIRFQGKEISRLSANERADYRRKHIGYVTQQFHLLDDRNAFDNVALPLQYSHMRKSQIKDKVADLLDKLDIGHVMSSPIASLSGGERQRVAIARAIVKEPDLLLADEPTGSLDEATEQAIMEIFDRLRRQGMTLVIVTHDDSVAQRCGQVYELNGKRLIGR